MSAVAQTNWVPTPGLKWHIQYDGIVNTNLPAIVYNIDLFDTTPQTMAALKANNKNIICYFSAGSSENWRPDFNRFPASVLGRNLDGWSGEKWLDIRQLEILLPIMRDRMLLAAQKGCDGVDPDNVDGYANTSGFPLTYADSLAYNIELTKIASELGLAIGLKNNLDQIKDLQPLYDFAVNEQCYQYKECALLKPFADANKPVYGIEYKGLTTNFCPKANAAKLDFQKKRLSLNAWNESCR